MVSSSKVVGGLTLFLIAAACLIFNVFVIIIFLRRKTIRTPVNIFLLVLAVVDLTSLITWTLFTFVSVISEEWLMTYGLCQFQEYFWSFCHLINMHVLCILALERCLLIFRPSRHQEICRFRVAFTLFSGIVMFDAVIAAFPFMGWGVTNYFGKIYQCITNYEQNVRHMNFLLTLTYVVPLMVIIIAYAAVFIRIALLRKHSASSGALVLEENDEATGDCYSNRLKKQQTKFQNAGMKTKKPKFKDQPVVYTNRGYINNQESTDEDENVATDSNERVTKKAYYLSKNDFVLTRTFLLATLCYVISWMPYVILSYIWTYSRYTPITLPVFIIVCWLTHCGTFIKPLIYVVSCKTFRKAFMKTFNRKGYYKNKTRGTLTENTKEEDLHSTGMKNYLV